MPLDTTAYLNRINYSGAVVPSAETLRQLQLHHLLAVPFENLSIHSGEPIILNDNALFEKIVLKGRGGFCYELNGLFAALLGQLGFDVQMLSASVANSEGVWGPEFDHMTLIVTLEERWLVDVGFGDSFTEPLLLDERGDQIQGSRSYRIEDKDDCLMLSQKEHGGDWKPQYRFTLTSHVYADYADMCRFHQTSPDSHFTRGYICSKLTSDGRTTISRDRLIVTKGGAKEERELKSEEVDEALRTYFGFVM